VLERIGNNQDYRRLCDELLGLVDFLKEKKEEAQDAASFDRFAGELKSLYDEAAAVVCEFVGRKDLKQVEHRFMELYRVFTQDPKITEYLHNLRKWATSILDHPEKIKNDETIDEANKLIEQARLTFEGKPEQVFSEISKEWRHMLDVLQKDEYAAALKESFQEVQQAFEGSVFQALSQTRVLAIPILKEILREIPLPKIIGRTTDSAYTIDGLVLQGRELNLDDITFEFNFGMKQSMVLVVKINDIEGTIRNAHFTYVSSGLFDWQDEGTFTCHVTSPRWKLKWIIEETPNQPLRLRLLKVDGSIDKLDITIEQARHKLLDRVSLALFSGEIKRKTCLVAENALLHQARLLTNKFNQFFLQKHFYEVTGSASLSAAPEEFVTSSNFSGAEPVNMTEFPPIL